MRLEKRETTSMRHVIGLALAASVSAIALGSVGNAPARAADMPTPEYGYQQQPPAYYPPQQPAYYPPQQTEAYPPPPPPVAYYAYAPAPVVVAPYPYYLGAPYWHGYAPRVAYGYGHWGRGYRRW
jgi:hypothetical protein